MDSLRLDTVGSAVAGGAFCALIARYFILKAFDDLSRIKEQIHGIGVKLSAIEVQLGRLDRIDEKTHSNEFRITEIASRLKYERPTRSDCRVGEA